MTETAVAAPDAPSPLFPRLQKLWDTLPAPRRDTRSRIVFDLLFGAAVPVALFQLELHWLPDALWGMVELGVLPFRPYEPVAAFACVLALLAWYPLRRREGWWQAAAAGPLLLGAGLAFGIGAALAPLSAVGALMMGIGLLGFLPFLTAAVFADAGFRAIATARRHLPTGPVFALALLAAGVFSGACLGTARVVRIIEIRATEVLAGEREGDAAEAEARLRALHRFPGVDLDSLRRAGWETLPDGTARSPAAGEAWVRITGRPLRPEVD